MCEVEISGEIENFNNNNTYLDIDDLYAWIDTIPLSRPKKNISRDFADGVLVAEVVAHFLPKLVDLHNYPAASSINQRKINWQTLNRRVFAKMCIRVSDDTITQAVDAKPGVIEQILMDLRVRIEELRSSDRKGVSSPNLRRSKSIGQSGFNSGSGFLSPNFKNSSGSQSPNPNHNYNLNNNNNNSYLEVSELERAATAHPNLNSSRSRPGTRRDFFPLATANVKSSTVQSQNRQNKSNINVNVDSLCSGRNSPPPPSTTIQYHEAFVVGSGNVQPGSTVGTVAEPRSPITKVQQGYVAGPARSSTLSIVGSGKTPSRPAISCPSGKFDEPPPQIIYRGHKMIPLQCLDEKEKEMKTLESANRSLTLKIFRLETLVNIKDQRVEDLTYQLQNLRGMYERVTENAFNTNLTS